MSSVVEATARKALADMDPEELHQWLVKRRKLLTHHKRFVQRYLDRQHQRGNRKPTHIDRQYAQFQRLADDLLELLDSVVFNVEQHVQDATSEKVSSNEHHHCK